MSTTDVILKELAAAKDAERARDSILVADCRAYLMPYIAAGSAWLSDFEVFFSTTVTPFVNKIRGNSEAAQDGAIAPLLFELRTLSNFIAQQSAAIRKAESITDAELLAHRNNWKIHLSSYISRLNPGDVVGRAKLLIGQIDHHLMQLSTRKRFESLRA
jgi:hypothetical protein